MVKLLQQNPGVAIPVILSRLQQKDGEWRRIKDDMAPLWGKVSSSALWSGRGPAAMHATMPVWVHDIRMMPATALGGGCCQTSPAKACCSADALVPGPTLLSCLHPCMSGGCSVSSRPRAHSGHTLGAVPSWCAAGA